MLYVAFNCNPKKKCSDIKVKLLHYEITSSSCLVRWGDASFQVRDTEFVCRVRSSVPLE